jgi:hypothetical protein
MSGHLPILRRCVARIVTPQRCISVDDRTEETSVETNRLHLRSVMTEVREMLFICLRWVELIDPTEFESVWIVWLQSGIRAAVYCQRQDKMCADDKSYTYLYWLVE